MSSHMELDNRRSEQLLSQIDAAETLHGFTTAVVCAGSNANSDGGLGAVHESKLATGVRSPSFAHVSSF